MLSIKIALACVFEVTNSLGLLLRCVYKFCRFIGSTAPVAEGPYDQPCFTYDIFTGYCSPVPGVIADSAVVAHDEEFILGDQPHAGHTS